MLGFLYANNIILSRKYLSLEFHCYFAQVDSSTLNQIIQNSIKVIEASEFQAFCDRMLIKIFSKDFTPVRAGGSHGDMKNDGYCHIDRRFFAAHATRGEAATKTKAKIASDLDGCLKKQLNVREFIYLTNDTLIGQVEVFVDTLREKHKDLEIHIWGPLKLAEELKNLPVDDIGEVLQMNLTRLIYDASTPNPEKDFGIIGEIINHVYQTNGKEYVPEGQENRLKHILKKIELNFTPDCRDRVKGMFNNSMQKLLVVQEYIAEQFSEDENRVWALKEKVQELYVITRGCANTNDPVNDLSVFGQMATEILPEERRTNPEYLLNAKAMVLFFFEMCDIGKKTGEERNSSPDLFSNLL